MSSLFKDPCFESMDPISKMVEPFTSPIFEVAQRHPMVYRIPFEKLRKALVNDDVSSLSRSSYQLDSRRLLIDLTDVKATVGGQLDPLHFTYYLSMWNIETSHDEMTFLAEDCAQDDYGDIVLSLDQDVFKQDAVKKWFTEAVKISINYTSTDKSQVKTLLEHLSFTKRDVGRNLSSTKDLSQHVYELIKSDTWRIRSSSVLADLSDAFSSVLRADQGWGVKLTDLIHFKILTHSGNPLYSFPRTKE